MYASACAGSFMFGSFNNSCVPSKIYLIQLILKKKFNYVYLFQLIFTCFIVIAGLQSLSSSNNERQTVPDG